MGLRKRSGGRTNDPGRVCCFCGHRNVSPNIYPALQEAVERHVAEFGVMQFLVGGYGDFDALAARAVQETKATVPGIRLTLVLAYLPEPGRTISTDDYDETLYPEGLALVPRRFAISRRNQWMVDASDCLIAYVACGYGGAAQMLKRARAKQRRGELTIANLAAP